MIAWFVFGSIQYLCLRVQTLRVPNEERVNSGCVTDVKSSGQLLLYHILMCDYLSQSTMFRK